jgi:hypothetical protein
MSGAHSFLASSISVAQSVGAGVVTLTFAWRSGKVPLAITVDRTLLNDDAVETLRELILGTVDALDPECRLRLIVPSAADVAHLG